MRCDEQIAVGILARVAGQRIEQIGEVGADLGRGGRADRHPHTAERFSGCSCPVPMWQYRRIVEPSRRTTNAVLQCVLSPTSPYATCTPACSSAACPLDVGLLVESRLDLDQCDDLLTRLRGVDQRVDDRGVARRAVQRLLDREHIRVGGGLFDEPLHRRGERVVGVVHEHVAVAQRREDALGGFPFTERGRGRRHERRVLQLRAVDAVDLPQRTTGPAARAPR